MNVIHLSKFYKPYSGGLESVVADIAEGIINYEVSVLAADPDNLNKSESINGVKVIRSKELMNIASTSIAPGYIFDVIKSCKNNIIHVHLPNPMANIALFCAFLCGRDISNIVVHWHSDIVKQQGLLKLYQPLQTWLLNKAKKIIVTSQNYLDSSEPLQPFLNKCEVIPIGIDSIENRVDSNLVDSIKAKYKDKKIVFSLGRHIYYKGFEYLIEAARNVEGAVFLIGGKGPDTESYSQKICEYGLQDKVFLIGRVEDDDLPSYYAAADVFAFPSIEKSEAFGVVQLESMSVGTPIVATDIQGSGVPWVNKHMISGLVCKPKNSADLAIVLNKILDDSELHQKLSHGAKQRYTELFTKEKMIMKIESIYKDMTKK
jgi:glycosyltransferase involved in cell wall biosynthesis